MQRPPHAPGFGWTGGRAGSPLRFGSGQFISGPPTFGPEEGRAFACPFSAPRHAGSAGPRPPTVWRYSMTHLPRSAVIDSLCPRDRSNLIDRAVPRSLVAGERLYLAGQYVDRIHLVCSGVIKMTAADLEGRETILCLGLPGDVIGDIAALEDQTQPLDAVAIMRTSVLGCDATLFTHLLESNPAAGVELARALAQRTRWIIDIALERTGSERAARLAGRLLDLADLVGHARNGAVELAVPLPQADLGGLAGMCRESANRTLQEFKKEGVVDYRGRKLRILRPDVLERIRCDGTRASRPRLIPGNFAQFPQGAPI